MTRIGKIARLPRQIRDQLNRRLENNEPGLKLIKWLNGLPAVKKLIKTDFHGHPITPNNLTEWKKGGFIDWQTHQETLALTRDFIADAGELPNHHPRN